MAVFITQSNARRILRDMDTKAFKEDVLKDKFIQLNFLSKKDKESIAAYRCLCKNPNQFAKVYNKLDKRRFNYNEVFTGGGYSCYHSSRECSRLTASYFNIEIPESIRGKEARKEFRQWFKENQQLYQSDIDGFNKLLKKKYKLDSLREIKLENTGIYFTENMSAEELTEKCNEIKSNYLAWKKESIAVTDVLNKYVGKLYLAKSEDPLPEIIVGVSDEEAKQIMRKCDNEFRKPFIHYFIELIRIKHNPDLVFDKKVLDQLGFKPCSECCKQEIVEEKTEETVIEEKVEQPVCKEEPKEEKVPQPVAKPARKERANSKAKSISECASLFEKYKDVEKVAKERKLAVSTTYEYLFTSGVLNPKDFITEEEMVKAIDIVSNKKDGEQTRPKLEAILDLAGICAFYYISHNQQ